MSLYVTGTITGALNATTISGTGTKWSDAKLGITNGSVLFISSNAGVDGVYQVKRVISDTSIELAQPIYKTFTNSKYSILVAESASTAAWSNQLAATLGYYQAQMDGWQQIMTGTGDVALTAPDGTKVTIKSFTKLADDLDEISNKLDEKADKVSGAVPINQGGTGETTAKDARKSLGLGEAATLDTGSAVGEVLTVGTLGFGGTLPSSTSPNNITNMHYTGLNDVASKPTNDASWCHLVMAASAYYRAQLSIKSSEGIARAFILNRQGTASGGWAELYTTANTTRATDGTLKAASPIVKIFGDGGSELNSESEGVEVNRESVGVYRISNVLGMNSDGAWGGIDGGFDVPKDRNGQRLLWLDYDVEADGSIIVKTYHRTYPDAPIFARNTKDGYEESDPIDIPSDQFLSVRVEMPQDSIWNQAQKAAQEAMAQEQIVQE